MPSRPTRPGSGQPVASLPDRLVLPGAIIALSNTAWFEPLAANLQLRPGTLAPKVLRVPEQDAQAVLRGIIRLVADVRANAPPTVVWVAEENELLVFLDRTRISCASGMVTISLSVTCDEVGKEQRIDVPFAVGTAQRPAGLVMSTFDRVQGPAVITDTWGASLTAFAWEALITVAQQLAAAMGKDSAGRPLMPGTIAAEPRLLLIGAMARNTLTFAEPR